MPEAIELSRGVPFAPRKSACEVTCAHCHTSFRVMRLKKGHVLCPTCCRQARGPDGVLEWASVAVVT